MSWISDVKHDLGKLDVSVKSLKKFGITVGIVFLLISAWFMWANFPFFWKYLFFAVGALLLSGGILIPAHLKTVYKIWMGLAFVLGWLVSRVILTILFFLVLLPVGILAKIFGKKFIDTEIDEKSGSYWIKRKDSKINYEKMF
ncbi:MAG: SxtJ family membrane protein [Ignavibacteriaceae bacterium]